MKELHLLIENLDEDDKLALEQILHELENGEGDSETLKYLYDIDYEEIPVSIDVFIEDEDYLGGLTDKGTNIYPYWRGILRDIFDGQWKYQEVIFSGAIGTGKSTIASIGILYILYTLLCLRNPPRYYNLPDNAHMGAALINMSLDTVFAIAFRKIQDMAKKSPWFLRNGRLLGRGDKTWAPKKGIEIVPASNTKHTIGRDIYCCFLDEVSFTGSSDPAKARKQVMELYTNILRRMESRYRQGSKVHGLAFIVSSKNRASDFLEQYMDTVRGRDDVLVVDEPIWVIKGHTLNLSGKTFKLAIGSRLLPTFILTEKDNVDKLMELGYKRILDVPEEYRRSFETNVEKALNDIAGIATDTTQKFMLIDSIKRSIGTIDNCFTVPSIKLGLKSPFELYEFFDITRNNIYQGRRIHIHLDLSKSGDRTGISLVALRDVNEVEYVDPSSGEIVEKFDVFYDVIGCVALEALPGSEIPYYKIKNFVDHVSQYYQLGSVTADGYQSLEMIQYFTLKYDYLPDFVSKVVSVDRYPDAYYNFRTALDEDRIRLPDHALLREELYELEQGENMKVDHTYTESGAPSGSKDVADAICGAMHSAFLHKGTINVVNESKMRNAKNLANMFESLLIDEDEGLMTF